jgi:predicted deacetylase
MRSAAVRDLTTQRQVAAVRRVATRRQAAEGVRSRHATGTLAVALHDVAPATYERCALIREWLDDLGVDRVTLLVIPAPELHPFFARSPALAAWLLDCRDRGDAIAQHGLQHRRTQRSNRFARPLRGRAATEFPGLSPEATAACVDAGRRVLELAGVPPRGFVAPGYAYTPALRDQLADRFDWWATLLGIRHTPVRATPALSPVLCLGTASALKRAASPALLRLGSAVSGPLLRLDLHPADFDHPGHVRAVEALLRRAQRRTAVTYDELC